jgi:hypothetical protein
VPEQERLGIGHRGAGLASRTFKTTSSMTTSKTDTGYVFRFCFAHSSTFYHLTKVTDGDVAIRLMSLEDDLSLLPAFTSHMAWVYRILILSLAKFSQVSIVAPIV